MSARKRTPTPEAEVVLAVFQTADALRRHLKGALSGSGLSLQQYNVLRILRGAGDTLPTMEIKSRMMERAPGITRIVDGLATKGLVERQFPERDRRQVLCRLTRRGSALLRELDPAMDAADLSAFRNFGRARLRTLAKELRAIVLHLAAE